MPIVKMKKLRLLGLIEERDKLLNELLPLGCVEVSGDDYILNTPEFSVLLSHKETQLPEFTSSNSKLSSSLVVLNKYAPYKTSMFAPRRSITVQELFDSNTWVSSLEIAEKLIHLEDQISHFHSEESRLRSVKMSLMPWERADLPLDTPDTKNTAVVFATLPTSVKYEDFEAAVYSKTEQVQLFLINSDKTQYYLIIICHKSVFENVFEVCREHGLSIASFSALKGTASENIAKIDREIEKVALAVNDRISEIVSYSSERENIQLCVDRSSQEILREAAKEKLLSTEKVYSLRGWLSAPEEKKATALLDKFCCAYELSDPEPDDVVPVKLKENKITEPLNMVTEMYSLPAYDGIDPNPLIMPFFTLFFGFMYADIGYGIILTALGLLGRHYIKRKSIIRHMTGLLVLCGTTTIIFGVLFGSLFGDALPVFCDLIGIDKIELWSIINPLEASMSMLIISLSIGCFQIFVGMAIKAYMLIRDGHPFDALFDVGSWWLLFAGLALGAFGYTWYVALAGAAILVLTQGRSKPTIIGKLVSGLASLYNITAYFGDVLSYTRLMALLLASSVIASVVNVLGSLSGSIIVFILVFIIGHVFNMGINLIGTYVHSARLQYLEYFGKFYKDGGRPFDPLSIKTKYTEII